MCYNVGSRSGRAREPLVSWVAAGAGGRVVVLSAAARSSTTALLSTIEYDLSGKYVVRSICLVCQIHTLPARDYLYRGCIAVVNPGTIETVQTEDRGPIPEGSRVLGDIMLSFDEWSTLVEAVREADAKARGVPLGQRRRSFYRISSGVLNDANRNVSINWGVFPDYWIIIAQAYGGATNPSIVLTIAEQAGNSFPLVLAAGADATHIGVTYRVTIPGASTILSLSVPAAATNVQYIVFAITGYSPDVVGPQMGG